MVIDIADPLNQLAVGILGNCVRCNCQNFQSVACSTVTAATQRSPQIVRHIIIGNTDITVTIRPGCCRILIGRTADNITGVGFTIHRNGGIVVIIGCQGIVRCRLRHISAVVQNILCLNGQREPCIIGILRRDRHRAAALLHLQGGFRQRQGNVLIHAVEGGLRSFRKVAIRTGNGERRRKDRRLNIHTSAGSAVADSPCSAGVAEISVAIVVSIVQISAVIGPAPGRSAHLQAIIAGAVQIPSSTVDRTRGILSRIGEYPCRGIGLTGPVFNSGAGTAVRQIVRGTVAGTGIGNIIFQRFGAPAIVIHQMIPHGRRSDLAVQQAVVIDPLGTGGCTEFQPVGLTVRPGKIVERSVHRCGNIAFGIVSCGGEGPLRGIGAVLIDNVAAYSGQIIRAESDFIF